MEKEVDFSVLVGKLLTKVEIDDDVTIDFYTESEKYSMYHINDCCEDVCIEDIVGELDSLVGNPILLAEKRTNTGNPEDEKKYGWQDGVCLWTFYELATINGNVTLRWYGESNGYYSVDVDFFKIS